MSRGSMGSDFDFDQIDGITQDQMKNASWNAF